MSWKEFEERAPVDVKTLLQEQHIRHEAALKDLQKVAPELTATMPYPRWSDHHRGWPRRDG